MIVSDRFKSYSLFTAEELNESILRDLENMSDEERAVFYEILQDPHFESDLNAMELDREMVSVTQWIEDDYYMGTLGKTIYKPWKDDLVELFESSQYDTAVVCGGIGCASGDTLIQLADGSIEQLKELAGKAFDVNPWRGSQTAVGVFNGVKPVYEMKIANGFTIKATAEHKWMTQDGWVRTDQINPAYHRIRSPRFITSTPIRFDVTVAEAEWAGIFCSAGKLHTTEVKGVKRYFFIKSDPERLKLFTDLCCQLDIKFEHPSNTYVSMDASDLTALFKKLDITDPIKYRTIPKPILQSSNTVLAGFIRGALISAVYSGIHNYFSCSVTFTSHLEVFLQYMTLAFKRFGIRSRVVHADRISKTFNLAISGKSNINLFAEHISIIRPDIKNKFNIMVEVIKGKVEKSHADFLPVNYGDALAWTKKHKVSIGATKYAKWCGRDSADLKVSHVDVLNFCKQWPHMHAHAYELFFDTETIWEEIRSIQKTDNVIPVFDLMVPDDNSYLAYGMLSHNSGKSTFSHLAVLRMIYEASCLKNPAVSYGLASGSIIGFCSLAKSKETARRVVFEQLAHKIQESPYFKYDFPPVKDLKAEIVFPKGLAIIAGSSTDTSIIGMNIFGGIIDEVNFWGRVKKSSLNYGKNWGGESKSGRLFDSVRRRMKSRYVKKGKLPGIIMLVSSKSTVDSFTDQFVRKEQAMGTLSTFVRDRSILEMKKGSFSDRTFRVLIGTIDYASKIILDGEDVSNYKDAIVIDIPEDFRSDFEANLEESLRDIAGVSTIAISNFITKVEKINEMIDKDRIHPFQCPLLDDPNTWDSRRSYKMNWYALCDRKPNGEWVPKLNPEAPRHLHYDPAFTGDAFGFCLAHVGGMIPVQESGEIIEYQPVFVVDFVLAIQGSKDEEVIFRNVRELTYEFSSHGFHIAEVSMDTYQSRDACQALEQNGYKAGIYSVDTGISSRGENVVNTAIGRIPKAKQAYWYLRSAIYEGRVKCYDYPILYRELRRLEDGPEKVDHPDGEGKDLADALCGVVWTLFRSRYSGEFLAPSKGITLNPRAESESMADYQESITDRYSNTVDNLLDQALAMKGKGVQELAGVKVYEKTKPKSISPKYQKVNMDNTVDDLTYNPEDFVQRG